MKEEIFVPIIGYEGLYEISNHGRVKSCAKTWGVQSGSIQRRKKESFLVLGVSRGYNIFALCNGSGVKKYVRVHRLVALHFIENPNNYPVVNHLDSVTTNNYFENLEWTTSSGNAIHAFKNGRRKGTKGEDHHMVKYKEVDILKIRELYATGKYFQREIAKMYNDRQNNISRIIRKERWKHI